MAAIFNTSSFAELSAILTEHPVRGVIDGDIATVAGESGADNSLTYIAELKGSPVTSLPDSVASDDGRVQWNLGVITYGDGGIPKSLQADFVAGSLPATWSEIGADQDILYERMTAKHEANVWGQAELWLNANGAAWLLHETGIQKIDTKNNNDSLFYEAPVFTGESASSDFRNHATALCKSTGIIHFVGGTVAPQNYHHTFNTSTGTYSDQALAPLPVQVTGAKLHDMSGVNNNLYLLTQSLIFYKYNIPGNTWTPLANIPVDDTIKKVMPDYENSNSFIVIFSTSFAMYRFNVQTEAWVFIRNLGGDGFDMNVNGFACYDFYSQRYVFIHDDDITYYDPVLDSKTNDLANVNILEPFLLEAPCAHLGGGYYIACNTYEDYAIILFAATQSISAEKVTV